MHKMLPPLVVAVLSVSPLIALANPGGVPNGGVGQGGGVNGPSHGGAPLPIVGAGIPGLAVLGAGYLIFRRRRTNKTDKS
jgi:hypothetical protein